MSLTRHLDLRTGKDCWREEDAVHLDPDPLPRSVDTLVIGAGVSGALIAEALTAAGIEVALIDRRHPAHGATAASTALVMWAADTPLSHLARDVGPVEAARRWSRVHAAVQGLDRRVQMLGIACDWAPRDEIYLQADLLDPAGLRAEFAARYAARLPSCLLEPHETADFGLPPSWALVSQDCWRVDPVELTLGMLTAVRSRGARLCFPHEATDLTPDGEGWRVSTGGGAAVRAKRVVLATGYELATRFPIPGLTLGSSYAIATAPGVGPIWGSDVMVWQAAESYLYARTTGDGRVIVGGEDEDGVDGPERDVRLTEKAAVLAEEGAVLLGVERLEPDCAWTAVFGSSPDGLPVIGEARGAKNVWIANGFGGNGITFAALASEIITAAFEDRPDADASCFDPWRFSV